MADSVRVKVSGLPEVRRALRQIQADSPDGLQRATKRAAQIVAADARRRVPIGPGRNGHVRSSFKVVSSRGGATVQAGGTRYPYLPWLEFGGRVGRNNSVYRKRIKAGRYLWVALAESRPRIQAALRDELEDIARKAR
jgi:hypothetical protein